MLASTLSDGTPATQPSSIYDFSLLTPPLSYASSEDVPFKPDASDQISLSMKSRHRQRERHQPRRNRACLSNNELNSVGVGEDRYGFGANRPISMPSFRLTQSVPVSRKSTVRDKRNMRLRRWTLPPKASATRVLDITNSLGSRRIIEFARSGGPTESPAMITLRRATTSKSKPRLSFTSFPPPSFGRTRTGLLSTFLDTIMGANNSEPTRTADAQGFAYSQTRSRLPSIVSREMYSENSACAPVVCTEVVDVRSSISQPGFSPFAQDMRRCSTRYVSGNSTYEVLWDETASSNTSGAVPSSFDSVTHPRRGSIATTALESQLHKAAAEPRRRSMQTHSGKTESTLSAGERDTLQRRAFEDLLNFTFIKVADEAALQGLPRSGDDNSFQQKASFVDEHGCNMLDRHQQESIASISHMEFFPPLVNQDPSATQDTRNLANTRQIDKTMPIDLGIPSELIDAKSASWRSTYVQRIGGATYEIPNEGIREGSNATVHEKGNRKTSIWMRSGDKQLTEDRVPLLSPVTNGL